MNKIKLRLAILMFIVFCFIGALIEKALLNIRAIEDGLGLTPPMGWYPWNTFGQEPQNEKLIKEIVDALISNGMREVGYKYVGPDEGICYYRGGDGRLTTNLERFPSGLRKLGDYIHQKGLKYALYTDAGTLTCSKAMPGTKGHEYEDMLQFAEWRCDYLKVDWCNTEGQDMVETFKLLHEAQRAAGRAMILSICTWGLGFPWLWGSAVGHLWRTTGDICEPGKANWERALKIALANEKLFEYAGPGHWNDPDMMIVGMPGLSEAQNRSFFSLWCMMASPLIAGNDLRNMSKSTKEILTNLEVISVNQDPLGIQGHIVRKDDGVSIWGNKKLFDGSQAVLAFNQNSSPAEIRLNWSDFGFDKLDALYVRDLWKHETVGPFKGGFTVNIMPNDVVMLRISKSNDFLLPPIISVDTYLISLKSTEAIPQMLSGKLTIYNQGSTELPLWKVHGKLPSWLSVTITKKGKNQIVTNIIRPAGLPKGLYHSLVRLDNIEPISGRPMTAIYYDIDLEIVNDVGETTAANKDKSAAIRSYSLIKSLFDNHMGRDKICSLFTILPRDWPTL